MSNQNLQRNTSQHTEPAEGSPFTSLTPADADAMLEAIGAESVESLFDIPDTVRFDGQFGIEGASEQAVRQQLAQTLEQNEETVEFLGRGHYAHYVPSIVDHLSQRSEFITSYTQYQPEITQGFLQVLFEYQSLLVELTGLGVANCSMYDAATALGEAATLADRVRQVDGSRVLVPDYIRNERLAVLENYVSNASLTVEAFATANGQVNLDAFERAIDDDVVLAYVENPTNEGIIEEQLTEIGAVVDDHDALFCLGSDLVALSLLQTPVSVGADIVIGDASVLGLPSAYGMGLGVFACREKFLRQVPGRLVGVSKDDRGSRAFTLTLQTREQHIRRERATSNICTNQAWVALRSAIHATSLGPSGLISLAKQCHRLPTEFAAKLDEIEGVTAPVRDCYHFREFRARLDADAHAVADELRSSGYSVHACGDDELQLCVTELTEDHVDDFCRTLSEVLE